MRQKTSKSPAKSLAAVKGRYAAPGGALDRANTQPRHQKSGTQAINVRSILRNAPRVQQSFFNEVPQNEPLRLTQTFDRAVPTAKPTAKSAHDLKLSRELHAYRVEVETRFNNSEANKHYSFPRTCADSEEPAAEENSSKLTTIPACTHLKQQNDVRADPKPNPEVGKPVVAEQKENATAFELASFDTGKNRRTTTESDLFRKLKAMLRPETHQKRQFDSCGHTKSSKTAFYGTQRLAQTKSPPRRGPQARQSRLMNSTMYIRPRATRSRSNERSQQQQQSVIAAPRRAGTKNDEAFPSMDSTTKSGGHRRTHARTRTLEGGRSIMNLTKVFSMKKSGTRARGAIQMSNYFKGLLMVNNQKAHTGSRETRPRGNMSGVFSTSTLNMTGGGGRPLQ